MSDYLSNRGRFSSQNRFTVRIILFILYCIAGSVYLIWRFQVFNFWSWGTLIWSWIFYITEVYCFLRILLAQVTTLKLTKAKKNLSISLDETVDVFITTYNEPIEVIRATIIGAVNISYPHTTWLLDDGNRPELKELALFFNCRYLARTTNKGAKAGNLNNGFKHAKGDFVLLLDADHVATPQIVHELLGYFENSKVGFVQTPQDYYNENSYQHGSFGNSKLFWHEQSHFHYVSQTGADSLQSCSLCGCSALLRRSTIDDVGGFPEETVTEDMHFAIKIYKKGYISCFHNEPLAYGIAPIRFVDFLRQRLRWGQGNMQVFREENVLFSSQLSFAQKISTINIATPYVDGWSRLILYLSPIITIFFNLSPIFTDASTLLFFLLPYACLGVLLFNEGGQGYGRLILTEKMKMAMWPTALLSTLGVFRKKIKFRVSSKDGYDLGSKKLYLPYLLIFLLGVAAIIFAVINYYYNYEVVLTWGVTLILILAAGVNIYFAFLVLLHAWECDFKHTNNYAFEVPLPLVIDERVWGRVRTIEQKMITFTLVNPDENKENLVENVNLITPLSNITVALKELKKIGEFNNSTIYKAHLVFAKPNEQDELNSILYNCKWHRYINGKYEQSKTIIDYIINAFAPATKKIGQYKNVTPIIFKLAQQESLLFHLGFVIESSTGRELTTFVKIESELICRFDNNKIDDIFLKSIDDLVFNETMNQNDFHTQKSLTLYHYNIA